MNNKSQLDVEHLEWAIDQRAKIQHTLLALYVYVRDTEPEESWVYTEAIVNSLIAASFSLWRAVFLAEQTRTDASVRQAQRDFLATVISTNAVTFSDDRRNSAWSLGFYMDTASQRVWSAIALTETHIEHFSSRDVSRYIVYSLDESVPSTRKTWEGLHAVVRSLFNVVHPDARLVVEVPQGVDKPL